MLPPVLKIKGIEKSFAEKEVLSGISFDLYPEEIIALLGPSGCGKSTLLSVIAGIETPNRGDIYWQGVRINDISPHRRGFGLMFQEDVLFPHMNVFENVAFGLKMQKKDQAYIQDKVSETLELVGLEGMKERDVNSLSGGEQQRVALARSIAPQPGLLMLDEPLSSLDRTLSDYLIVEIKRILREMKQTAIYVTHDQEEAFSIADRVVLMKAGRVEQIGTPEEIYHHPATNFVARFLGLSNLIPGIVKDGTDQAYIESPLGRIPYDGEFKGQVSLLIRPDSASINSVDGIILEGKVLEKTFQGNLYQVIIYSLDREFKFYFPTTTKIPEKGELLQFTINPSGIIPITEIQP
jgi:ABC-type Fe3+/spermidine/putrescine transport system ATPase subunit